MSLIIDNRERQLIPLLGAEVTVQTLAIGDIIVGNLPCVLPSNTLPGNTPPPTGGGGSLLTVCSPAALIIERKTIKDLEASVLDGRYREQKTRLLAHCQEVGASPLYILEGPYTSTTGRLAVPALLKLVARLQYKHGIPVLHTASLEETATAVRALADYYKEDPTNFARSTEPLRAVDSVHVTKKVNAADPKQFMIAALAQCPGVSTKVAEAIHTSYPSWSTLLAASEKDLAAIVQANGRKVGPAVAKRLCALLSSSP